MKIEKSITDCSSLLPSKYLLNELKECMIQQLSAGCPAAWKGGGRRCRMCWCVKAGPSHQPSGQQHHRHRCRCLRGPPASLQEQYSLFGVSVVHDEGFPRQPAPAALQTLLLWGNRTERLSGPLAPYLLQAQSPRK